MPPKKAIDWTSVRSYQRLLAAVYAASPQNHNYREIATMFGEGATYDSIEGRFRKIKAEAAILKQEVESGQRGPAPPRGGGGVKTEQSSEETEPTPKPKGKPGRKTKNTTNNTNDITTMNGVISGRITKPGRARGGGGGGGKGKATKKGGGGGLLEGIGDQYLLSNGDDGNNMISGGSGGGGGGGSGGGDDGYDDASYPPEDSSPTKELDYHQDDGTDVFI
ncbi:MAG: hypothetical protein M1823_004990 [Watsoniomyces obsoletus]|nr:MAG: hypothetical protein M1823_004990 [Watsoniomyces obsoletus]